MWISSTIFDSLDEALLAAEQYEAYQAELTTKNGTNLSNTNPTITATPTGSKKCPIDLISSPKDNLTPSPPKKKLKTTYIHSPPSPHLRLTLAIPGKTLPPRQTPHPSRTLPLLLLLLPQPSPPPQLPHAPSSPKPARHRPPPSLPPPPLHPAPPPAHAATPRRAHPHPKHGSHEQRSGGIPGVACVCAAESAGARDDGYVWVGVGGLGG